MPLAKDELIPTRATLIGRLKNWQDQSSWQEFFDTYWKLIYGVAIRSGLTDTEAQEVVQETMISVAQRMPSFRYDPAIGSFKAWLLNLTRWRVTDQFRKRGPQPSLGSDGPSADTHLPVETVDSPSEDLARAWESEWEETMLDAAIANVKRRLDPQKYQVFDLYVQKNWPAEKVAGAFGLSVDQVYLAKHRITDLIRSEVRRLESEMI